MSTDQNGEREGASGDSRLDRMVALAGLEAWIETPMLVLGFVWLGPSHPRADARAVPRDDDAVDDHLGDLHPRVRASFHAGTRQVHLPAPELAGRAVVARPRAAGGPR